jgi:hypothetical protein
LYRQASTQHYGRCLENGLGRRALSNHNDQLNGFISDAGQDFFTIVDSKTGSTRTVSYADTSAVKQAGSGLSTKSWIILGAAVAGAAITWVIVKPALCDGGAQTRGSC